MYMPGDLSIYDTLNHLFHVFLIFIICFTECSIGWPWLPSLAEDDLIVLHLLSHFWDPRHAPLCSAPEIFTQFFFCLFVLVLLNSLKILFWTLALTTLCFSKGAERTSWYPSMSCHHKPPGEVILKSGLYFASGWSLLCSFPDISGAAYSLLQVDLFPVVVDAPGSPRESYLRRVHVCSIFLEGPLLACALPFPVELLLLNERVPLYLVRCITRS